MRPCPRRRGFTLIELLVVVAIIVLLAGLILAGVRLLREQTRAQQSQAICQSVQQALHVAGADRGGRVAPAEHPLAGSTAPRHAFVRAADGSSVATGGAALRGVPLAAVASGRERILLPDDRYADPDVPLLYGLQRQQLGIIGGSPSTVTAYRLLPLQTATIADPDLVGRLVQPADAPAAARRVIEHALGRGNVLGELAKLGALYEPPDDSPLLDHDRVWNAARLNLDRSTRARLDGGWQHYRIRGLGIYDAWGNEILYQLDGESVVLRSAGPDGHFRFHPGADGSFQTAADASAPAGDDRDATTDNVVVGGAG